MICPEEFEQRMLDLKDNSGCAFLTNCKYETEDAHILADELMCEVLEQFGYHAGVKVFKEMGKWYS